MIFQYEYKESGEEVPSLCVWTAYRVHQHASTKSSRHAVELLGKECSGSKQIPRMDPIGR